MDKEIAVVSDKDKAELARMFQCLSEGITHTPFMSPNVFNELLQLGGKCGEVALAHINAQQAICEEVIFNHQMDNDIKESDDK